MPLQNPVSFAVIGSFLSVSAPVMGMLALPVSLAIFLVGLVIGITGQLVSLPLGFPGPLTGFVGAEALGFDPGIRSKMTTAMDASMGVVHGFLQSEATTLTKRLERIRKNKNQNQSRCGRKSRL